MAYAENRIKTHLSFKMNLEIIEDLLTSFHGVFNVYKKSEIEYQNADDIEEMILNKGLNTSDKFEDKVNLSNDFSKIKKDINKSWEKREAESL